MIASVAAWLLGSRVGHALLLFVLGAGVLGLIVLTAFRRGKQDGALERAIATAERVAERMASDDEIRRLPQAERRERLRQWARP